MKCSTDGTGSVRHSTPVATITTGAMSVSPPSSTISCRSGWRASTARVTTISAPRRFACLSARLARSSPEIPNGNPV